MNTAFFYPNQANDRRSVRKLLKNYAYPAMVNMIVLAVYNVVDRIFIGQGAGPLAICGLAPTLPYVSLLGTVGTLTGVGGAARISPAASTANLALASKILGNALFLNVMLSLMLIFASLYYLDEILLFFGGSEATIPYARQYLNIPIPGSLLTNLNFTLCHAIRAVGFPRKSVTILLAGAIANILLDPIFIFGFGMGIQGAAIATVVSMCVSLTLILLHFRSPRNPLHLTQSSFRPHLLILVSIIGMGMASFIMNITTGMVNIIMNRYLKNYGGDYAIGAYGIISSYSILISMLLMGICQGMQPIISYHYGMGNQARVRDLLQYALRMGTAVTCTGFALCELFAPWLVKCFTWDAHLAEISTEGLRYTFIAMPLVGLQIVATSYFQSVRQAPKAIVMNISRQFLFLIPALGVFATHKGLAGIWLAIPFADVMATLIAVFFIWKAINKH